MTSKANINLAINLNRWTKTKLSVKNYRKEIEYKRFDNSGLTIARVIKEKCYKDKNYIAERRILARLKGFNSWSIIGTYETLNEALFYADIFLINEEFVLNDPFIYID